MLTLLEGILLICLISMILYWRLSPSKETPKKDLEERVVTLERQNKELSELKKRYTVIVFTCNPMMQ